MNAISGNRCVYCLQPLTKVNRTNDHVIARSWYSPDRSPVHQWQVPACNSCNNKFSRIEGRLRQRLALAVDTKSPLLRRIYEQSRRTWTAAAGRSLLDAYHRHKARQTLLNDLVTLDSAEGRGVLPSSRLNFWKGSRTAIRLDGAELRALSEKWTRGVHACEIGELIESDYEIDVYFLDDRALPPEIADLMQYAKLVSQVAEVQVWLAYKKEQDQYGALYRFHIWQTFTAYTIVAKSSAEENATQL